MLWGVDALYPSQSLSAKGWDVDSSTERTVTEILYVGQEEVGTPTRGPAAGWR
jgi:hypothetical protein